ncbi:MAG: zinc metalloprotease HtpX [Chloroflexi bacterium]|nr:zinc metalloprotease HtpX [Chloroflexota bacterium]
MNGIKTLALLLVLGFLFLATGYLLGGRAGLVMGLVLSLAMNFFAYWFSDKLALAMNHARKVTPEEEPVLHSVVETLTRQAGMPMPEVYVIDSDSPNAFATGRDPQHAAVAATRGLLNTLTREELEGVMAHELSHVGNRDTLIMSVVAVIAGAISMVAMMARFGMMFGGGRDRENGGGNIISLLVVAIVMPLAALLVQLAISRAREYQADSSGALLSRKPLALASALEKLQRGVQRQPMQVPEGAAHLFIVNPLSGRQMANLFSTHPPLEERVARLREMSERL